MTYEQFIKENPDVEIVTEWEGLVVDECEDNFYNDIEELFDALGGDDEIPDVVFCADSSPLVGLPYTGDVINDSFCQGVLSDVEIDPTELDGYEELEAAFEKFVEANKDRVWYTRTHAKAWDVREQKRQWLEQRKQIPRGSQTEPEALRSELSTEVAAYVWAPWICSAPSDHKFTRYSDRKLMRISRNNAKTNRRERVLIEGEWLHPELSNKYLVEMLDTIRQCPKLDFMLVTERPADWRKRLRDWCNSQLNSMSCPKLPRHLYDWVNDWLNGKAPANILIGSIIKDQPSADDRIPHLLRISAAKRFVIYEATGAVDLTRVATDSAGRSVNAFSGAISPHAGDMAFVGKIDWVIMRGETGTDAKPMHPDWARAMQRQCAAAGVPFWFEWGDWQCVSQMRPPTWTNWSHLPNGLAGGTYVYRVGKEADHGFIDGVEWRQVPGGEE
jgi:protein gp37